MKLLFSFITLIITSSLFSQEPILLNENTLNKSVTNQTLIYEDVTNSLTIDDVLHDKTLKFELCPTEIASLDFTYTTYWVKFKVKNTFKENKKLIIETARPITNLVNLYEINDSSVVSKKSSGDGVEFAKKSIQHRKCLYILDIKSNEEKEFIISAFSDGEVLNIPLIFWDESEFLAQDQRTSLMLGIFYGILVIVVILFFQFYFALKDISFLYYTLYVFFLAILQFSLDGYSYQYFFPNNGFLANIIIQIGAGFSLFFLISYVQSFAKFHEHKKLNLAANIFRILTLVFIGLSFTGFFHAASYKVINGLSLVSLLFILGSVLALRIKGKYINPLFIAAYIILVIGATLFILSNFNILGNPSYASNYLKIASTLEIILLSISMADKYRNLQKDKEKATKDLLKSLAEQNELKDNLNKQLEIKVKKRTQEVQIQKEKLEEVNNDLLGSITYAQGLQQAILPPKEKIDAILNDSFVLFKPRDIVSGDFYFIDEIHTTNNNPTKLALFSVADCTGHGVPGAFMSLLGNNHLANSLKDLNVNSPSEALDYLNKGIVATFKRKKIESARQDGMDIAFCALNKESLSLSFAGAKNPVYIIRNKELLEFKGNKHPVGMYMDGDLIPFTNQTIQLEKNDMIYLFSDGYPDQFGGPKGKKMGYKRFKELLKEISIHSTKDQLKILEKEFTKWQKNEEQIDDVCVMGIRV